MQYREHNSIFSSVIEVDLYPLYPRILSANWLMLLGLPVSSGIKEEQSGSHKNTIIRLILLGWVPVEQPSIDNLITFCIHPKQTKQCLIPKGIRGENEICLSHLPFKQKTKCKQRCNMKSMGLVRSQ